jgi:hypothetical protein
MILNEMTPGRKKFRPRPRGVPGDREGLTGNEILGFFKEILQFF